MLLLQNIVEKENISQKEAERFFPPKAQDTIFDCLRQKTGIVKQQLRWFLIRHDCFTMANFGLGQPKNYAVCSGTEIMPLKF